MSTTHSPVGGKQSERSQLTFSWLLGKYTPRAVVSVCIRVTGARPRATCVSAAIRVSLLKEALLSRFYRRTETPVHRPRPIRERERGREKGNRDERNRPEHERTNGRNWKLDGCSILNFSTERTRRAVSKKGEIRVRNFCSARSSIEKPRQQMPAREIRACARCMGREKGRVGFPISASFFLSFFSHKRLRLETEGGRGRKKKCINLPAPIEATDAHRRRETTIHLPRVPLFVDASDLSRQDDTIFRLSSVTNNG